MEAGLQDALDLLEEVGFRSAERSVMPTGTSVPVVWLARVA
jgi:hypothetical protein